jgi:hypothetical protein
MVKADLTVADAVVMVMIVRYAAVTEEKTGIIHAILVVAVELFLARISRRQLKLYKSNE